MTPYTTQTYVKRCLLITTAIVSLCGCNHGVPIVNLGIDDSYVVPRMQLLQLDTALPGVKYCWIDEQGAIVGNQKSFTFVSATTGTFKFRVEVSRDEETIQQEFTITVIPEEIEYSPYIAEVLDYHPAPGQFINTMPQYVAGDTYEDILFKCNEEICGDSRGTVSLGAFGGYLTFRFDHTVVNVAGENDFSIFGNAIYQTAASAPRKGGSCEPGIVMVSLDLNKNGIPDDPWYELNGSEHYNPLTVRSVTVRYSQPDPNREIIANGNIADENYIGWSSSIGDSGHIAKNIYHHQDYFPKWENTETLTFSGTSLPRNSEDPSGIGSYFILYAFDWGYADNHPNSRQELCSFDISNAIDSNGLPVYLPGADFIRVYTGILQSCGWIGETSTEITQARDLHIPDKSL